MVVIIGRMYVRGLDEGVVVGSGSREAALFENVNLWDELRMCG